MIATMMTEIATGKDQQLIVDGLRMFHHRRHVSKLP
jgi:hypothetical protein